MGSVREPELYGEMTIVGARVVDVMGASDTARSIENLRLRALAAGTVIEIETLEAEVLGGALVASGTVPVPAAKAGEPARVSFDVSGIDVASLAASARGSQAVTTSISVGGEVMFPEGSFDRIEASGEIQDILLASEGGIIYLVETAEWRYGESGISVGEVHLEGDRTDLRVNVSPPGGEEDESLGVSVEGQLDLQVANAVLPDSAYLAGVASLDVEASSAEEGWSFLGDSRISEGELIVSSPAFAVTDLSAVLELDGDTFRVLDLEARAGGGTLEGEGALTIPGAEGEKPALRFDLAAENVRVEYPEGMRSEVSADLALESREDHYRLSGKIDIEQALYQRAISPARELLDALRRQTLELEGEPGLLGRIDLDLAVETERPAVVDNNLGQMRWTAGLLVTGTLAAPEASGTLQAVPGGTLSFGRNTYEIESARVELNTYPAEPPELDIRARTEVGSREIVLAVTGRTDNLRTSLESPSDPTLSRG
ncbi:MAG: translocation/assembly module TamB domain-containing protein, partial [Vicinamibacteria bacterium]